MVIKTTVNIKIITETKFYTGYNLFMKRQLDACSVFLHSLQYHFPFWRSLNFHMH